MWLSPAGLRATGPPGPGSANESSLTTFGADPARNLKSSKLMPTGVELPSVLTEMLHRGGADGESVLVLLEGYDLGGCEDLGRQLRRLRIVANARTMFIAAPMIDSGHVSYFVHRERIANVALVVLPDGDWAQLLSRTNVTATPAAMVVGANGKIMRGVMHTSKVQNIRAASFAEELGLGAGLSSGRKASDSSERDSEHISPETGGNSDAGTQKASS